MQYRMAQLYSCSRVANILSSPHYMWIIFNVHINVTITRLCSAILWQTLWVHNIAHIYRIKVETIARKKKTHDAIHGENDVKNE